MDESAHQIPYVFSTTVQLTLVLDRNKKEMWQFWRLIGLVNVKLLLK